MRSPELYSSLNGMKHLERLDFETGEGRARLRQLFHHADVVVTSARPRAFAQLGIPPAGVFRANPSLLWIAITGYGWMAERQYVAFGDDAAVAGGLVRWVENEHPHFVGDAIADPLTGIAATASAFGALVQGQGGWWTRRWHAPARELFIVFPARNVRSTLRFDRLGKLSSRRYVCMSYEYSVHQARVQVGIAIGHAIPQDVSSKSMSDAWRTVESTTPLVAIPQMIR